MVVAVYPTSWDALKWPWKRHELQDYLGELVDPVETSKWLNPDPEGPLIGIDQVVHFFFDDNDFDLGDVGYSLLDEDEVAAIGEVKAAIEAILETNQSGGDAYFLDHPLWGRVQGAAGDALILLASKGLARFT